MKNTLTIIVVTLLVLLFASCDGKRNGGYHLKCIDGVEYLTNVYALAPHFKPDGSLFTCDKG